MVRTFYDGSLPLGSLRDRWLLARTDHVLFLSQAAKAQAAGSVVPEERASVIQGAIDLARFDPSRPLPDFRQRLGLSPHHYVVGIVARVQPHRRFGVLLDAAECTARVLPDFRLVIVGRGTDFDAILRRPVAERGLEEIVRFAGYLTGDDYVGCLRAMDVKAFLVPGSDGSCRAVREAMAMGLPVVAADRGMLPEIVSDGLTGRVVRDTPDNLAGAFVELHDPARRARMSHAARAHALAHFDIRRQAELVEQIYSRLASDS